MPKQSNQKLKIYYLMRIMLEKTDEEHSITMQDILSELNAYGISAERKSIYSDLEMIDNLGISIEGEQVGKQYYYHVVDRQFELPELKLLVDAIQSSKFITVKKSNQLIKKLEGFCSAYERKQLQRQVYVMDRIKTMNESIYYSVDAIHAAIAENKKVRFHYFNWNIKKEMELRRDGDYYCISPWALSWDDENYYLIGYDSDAEKIKHYRVDKMLHISVVDEIREGKEFFRSFNMAEYAKKSFAMFGGEEENVKLLIKNSMAGVIIDRFGKDVTFVPVDKDHSTVTVKVAVSDHFFSWIFALGEDISIAGPENVVNDAAGFAKNIYERYNKET